MLFTFILQLHIILLIHIVINVYSRRCLFNWFINISSFLFIFYDFSHKRLTTRTLRILSNYGSNYLFNHYIYVIHMYIHMYLSLSQRNIYILLNNKLNIK